MKFVWKSRPREGKALHLNVRAVPCKSSSCQPSKRVCKHMMMYSRPLLDCRSLLIVIMLFQPHSPCHTKLNCRRYTVQNKWKYRTHSLWIWNSQWRFRRAMIYTSQNQCSRDSSDSSNSCDNTECKIIFITTFPCIRDFRLPPRCKWDLRSSGMLLSVDWQLVTDVSCYISVPYLRIKQSKKNAARPLKVEPIVCPKRLAITYHSTLRNIP
jgi:hypothetical protein